MTYKVANPSEWNNDFIVLDYCGVNLMFNKAQIVASLYVGFLQDVEGQNNLQITRYHQYNIPVVKVAEYLQSHFLIESKRDAYLLLILARDNLKFIEAKELESLQKKCQPTQVAMDYIALNIPGIAQMQNLKLKDLRLLPPGIRENAGLHGILGVRFYNDEVYYFLDLEKILSKIIRE